MFDNVKDAGSEVDSNVVCDSSVLLNAWINEPMLPDIIVFDIELLPAAGVAVPVVLLEPELVESDEVVLLTSGVPVALAEPLPELASGVPVDAVSVPVIVLESLLVDPVALELPMLIKLATGTTIMRAGK